MSRRATSMNQMPPLVNGEWSNAFPEALVIDYHGFIDILELPDLDDRHVLAVAIQTKTKPRAANVTIVFCDVIIVRSPTGNISYGIASMAKAGAASKLIDPKR